MRYFPLPGHPNSTSGALAVEAAANQGAFEQMYQRMYETQTSYSHNPEPQTDVLVGFARDLDLDLDQFQQDLADPATLQRVQADKADGETLGVQGTPTFFVDGAELRRESLQDLRDALDAALED